MEGKAGLGVGEVRRAHIIYFLSRMGRIEQPHLIRVHHLGRNGVHLRDVKRWLSDLRGKDMPNSFSWSYKRKYKRGYVWQDLMDDDLITPISDNEYVLKGSAILPVLESGSCDEKLKPKLDQEQALIVDTILKPDTSSSSSAKTSDRYEEDSTPFDSETSTSTAGIDSIETDTPDVEMEVNEKSLQDVEKVRRQKPFSSPVPTWNKTKTKSKTKNKSRSRSNGKGGCGGNVFHNLLNCGLVETNDAAIINNNKMTNPPTPLYNGTEIPRSMEMLISSKNSFNGAWNSPQQRYTPRKSSSREKKPSTTASQRNVTYKLVGKPHCSQCGKPFKPEKFQTHMKSCTGLKSFKRENWATKYGGGFTTKDTPTSHSTTSAPFNGAKPHSSF